MESLKVNISEENKKSFLVGSSMIPRQYEDRTVGMSTLTIIWFAMSIVISIFMVSGQLYPALTGWQIVLGLVLGHTLIAVIMWFTQDFGIKYGLPFPASLRSSFGYGGAYIPIFLRSTPALFWFGFQTWIAASAVCGITDILFGWSNLIFFIIVFGIIQIAHTYPGIKFITRLSWISSPLLLFVGIYLLVAILGAYDTTLGAVLSQGGEGGVSFSLAIMAIAGGWLTMSLSIMDITRECKVKPEEVENWWRSTRKFMAAQWLGLVPAAVFFGMIGVVCAVLAGNWNPIDVMILVIGAQSTPMLIVCLLFVVVATWTTNDTANLYPAAYGISSLAPSKINFGKGVVLAGIIGIAIRPWSAAGELITVMSTFGAALGPVLGILITDYYILRKRKLNLDDLYNPKGQYRYMKNWNPAAIIAYATALLIAIPLPIWDFMYLIGPVISGVLYYVLMKNWIVKKYPQKELM